MPQDWVSVSLYGSEESILHVKHSVMQGALDSHNNVHIRRDEHVFIAGSLLRSRVARPYPAIIEGSMRMMLHRPS